MTVTQPPPVQQPQANSDEAPTSHIPSQKPSSRRHSSQPSNSDTANTEKRPPKWSLGILNDKFTDEVPGSILLLSKAAKRNEPLGLRNAPARTSASSLPSPYATPRRGSLQLPEKKRTKDGKIILEPQPEESLNDPLNWPMWRRDCALLSLGFYCMLGGGMTPILAAGFNNVASDFDVSIPQVALTTGLYMMGMGLGSVVASPTAILWGKRPVYLVTSIVFLLSSVWCALSPSYPSLVIARIVQGFAVSPVECLPSATIAEIFFLHERAYRLGIYTLLLLGGKNLVPLVSAAIINSLSWRWVFWIVAIITGFCFFLLFLFVPETFWDRTPRPHKPINFPNFSFLGQHQHPKKAADHHDEKPGDVHSPGMQLNLQMPGTVSHRRLNRDAHVGFADDLPSPRSEKVKVTEPTPDEDDVTRKPSPNDPYTGVLAAPEDRRPHSSQVSLARHDDAWKVEPKGGVPATPALRNLNSPYYNSKVENNIDYFGAFPPIANHEQSDGAPNVQADLPTTPAHEPDAELGRVPSLPQTDGTRTPVLYTNYYRSAPPKSFVQQLKPWSGRLNKENWFRAAVRPFILFAYPAILWSTVVYSLSVGWLIVLSESVSHIYRSPDTYNFSALGTGLVYLSPFIGGVLGTAVAGKVSDAIVRFMARRNDGVYEPEFRLVMAIPVALATAIGLMGFGWSAEEHDKWIVPTIFFGIISFGCSLGSTTAITFAVDSYRQYAGEALVTLNFSKNIFHGLVFSLFFNHWLESDGPKDVFLALGGIQVACLLTTIPLYIYGKRARMWTVRKNLMEKF